MKMQSEHYEQLEQAVQRVQSENPTETVQSYLGRNFSILQFRWDLLYAAVDKGYVNFDFDALYAYLDDSHIDTALRRITGTT